MNSITSIFRECLKFLWNHWIHLVLLIPAAIAYTFVHESLHALAVIVQGGKMLEFVWVPSPEEWGHVRYEFPEGQAYSELVILLAPYLLPLSLLFIGIILIWRVTASRQAARWIGRSIYFWLILVPLFDLAHAAIPYQLGARNDFCYAFGMPTLFSSYVISFTGAFLAFGGYILQKRIYQSEQLSLQAYMVLAVLVVLLVVLMSL